MLAGVVWLGWSASPARACSTSACFDPVRTFGEAARVPGNLVRFEISNESQASALTLVLMRVDGSVVPLASREANGKHVIEPEAPVAADTELELHYEYVCGELIKNVYRFSTSDAAPLTRMPAKLIPFAWSNKYLYELPVAPTAMHLLDHEVTVDGKPLGDRATGGQPELNDGMIEVTAACDGTLTADSCGKEYTVGPGSHELRVVTTIVGEDAQPDPVQLEIETTCAGICSVLHPGRASSRSAWPGVLVLALAFAKLVKRRATAVRSSGPGW